jgi:hypothetical protein
MADSEDETDIISALEEHMDELLRRSCFDYGMAVYCDDHLGVQMVQAESLTIGQFGAASADVNPLEFWRCPKPGCERCYEPTMFGYYWHSGEMGSRIERGPEKQPRCNHPRVPFMYIGKFGQGRRYLCPLYKCAVKGEVVADAVVDEYVEPPQDPSEGLKSDERKKRTEMNVFRSFVSASGLDVDPTSPTNGDADQRYPDIGCTVSDKPYWFELGQIISKTVAQKINAKRRERSGGFSFDQELPFVEIIKKKAMKNYETQGAPVDLVLHFDLRLGSKDVVLALVEKHSQLLETFVNGGPFARVWIFDDWKKHIVWSKAKA